MTKTVVKDHAVFITPTSVVEVIELVSSVCLSGFVRPMLSVIPLMTELYMSVHWGEKDFWAKGLYSVGRRRYVSAGTFSFIRHELSLVMHGPWALGF